MVHISGRLLETIKLVLMCAQVEPLCYASVALKPFTALLWSLSSLGPSLCILRPDACVAVVSDGTLRFSPAVIGLV